MNARVRIRGLDDGDAAEVARLGESRGDHNLARCFREDWIAKRPNRGAALVEDQRIVGYLLAFYSVREIEGRREQICCLGSWYVEPAHRAHSLKLMSFLTTQEGYTFITLTPNAISVTVMTRFFGFRPLSTEMLIYPPLVSVGTLLAPARILSNRDLIAARIGGSQRRILNDHWKHGCGHYLVESGRGSSLVVTKRRTLRGIPVSEILYASNQTVAVRHFERLKWAVMRGDRCFGVMAEERILGRAPRPRLHRKRVRLFRSSSLGPTQIDNLYSEIVLT
jgi:hypothetical protein